MNKDGTAAMTTYTEPHSHTTLSSFFQREFFSYNQNHGEHLCRHETNNDARRALLTLYDYGVHQGFTTNILKQYL